MMDFEYIAAKILAPLFYPFVFGQRINLLYLGSALALAFCVYLARNREGRGLIKGFFTYCFPRSIYRHPSAITDYLYFLVNRGTFGLLFAPLVLSSAFVSGWTRDLLGNLWEHTPPGLTTGPADVALFTLVMILVFDFGIFAAHYLQHKVPLLWEFHKVHHSAEVLTPITVYRMHPVDDLLAGSIVGIMTGVAHGAFAYLYADGVGEFTVFKLNVVLFLFYVAGYNLRHSHVWLAYPGWLSHVFVSPAQHQIHHSSAPKHFDKNIGFLFAFWDWIAGTLYVPRGQELIVYGLDGGEHKDFDSVLKLYFLPFKNAAALLAGSGRRRQA